MSLKNEMRSLVRELDDIDNAAVQLWSWLPSEEEAKQQMIAENQNPDYVHDAHQPYASDMMLEACSVIAYLLGYDTAGLTDEQKAIVDSKRQ